MYVKENDQTGILVSIFQTSHVLFWKLEFVGYRLLQVFVLFLH